MPLMRDRLLSPLAVIGFLVFFLPGYLVFATFCFIDGLRALVLIASSFLTVPKSIHPIDCSEGGFGSC